jgi:AraC-like DNA-binding protein
MLFIRQDPPTHLAPFVKEFWIVENPDPAIIRQKIVPDGYEEIILHFGEPYRIQLYANWELQEKMLVSGQLRRYFFLENTGASGILGIKLMPGTIHAVFHQDMHLLVDRVPTLASITSLPLPDAVVKEGLAHDERIHLAIQWLDGVISKTELHVRDRVVRAVGAILAKHGMMDMESLADYSGISRRHLEREFRKTIGLAPKYFSRVIQFSYIFEAMQSNDQSWVDIALNSGYFDQSHFIRNFKAFTGESPAQYGFDEKNMANFFLRKH